MTYASLANVLGSTKGFEAMVGGNRVTLLHDGAQAFPAMIEAIRGARTEILLEMYWFHSDVTGMAFAEALMAKAREGVRVRVIYDAVGSFEAEERMWSALREAGCGVWEYNPVAPWRKRFRIGVVNRRNHRKVLVVDGKLCFTGGINIGDPWAPETAGGGGWRDDMIAVEGPAALQMRAVFVHAWKQLTGEELLLEGIERPSRSELLRGDAPVLVLANEYLGERRAIRRAYLRQIRGAMKTVYLTNSYFVPDRVIRRELARAVRRGVDVRVLVPGESDLLAVFHASRRLYDFLLRNGIKIYEWQRSVLHSKSAVIDGRWCTVGTYNLDHRSWRFNLEITVAVEDVEVAKAMERRYVQDLAHALPVDLHDWRFRPVSARMAEHFFYLFRKLL